ncbi:hypothetical protein [Streptomyces sp. 6N223]|uniref:hypothetical protein n=1 Tax=Streptomyces sp. 6N223 TaxID=3457412 RepID=UPI003FD302C6
MPIARVRATKAGGKVVDDPSEEQLFDLLAGMNPANPFVVVERLDRKPVGQHFMQVHLLDGMSYQVEYREGHRKSHFEALVEPLPEVVGPAFVAGLIMDWARDRDGWREALPWKRMRGMR